MINGRKNKRKNQENIDMGDTQISRCVGFVAVESKKVVKRCCNMRLGLFYFIVWLQSHPLSPIQPRERERERENRERFCLCFSFVWSKDMKRSCLKLRVFWRSLPFNKCPFSSHCNFTISTVNNLHRSIKSTSLLVFD